VANNQLELKIAEAGRALEASDVARLWKWEVPVRIRTERTQCPKCSASYPVSQALFTRPTGADFFGYTSSARAILIECKMLNKTSLPLGETGLKAHQFIHLRDCHNAGGIALLVWQQYDATAVIDMDIVQSLSEGRKSIPWKDIPTKFIKFPNTEPKKLLEPYLHCPTSSNATA